MSDPRKISPILRVGGSLGSFGEEGLEHIAVDTKGLECDVVIAPREWDSMNEDVIYLLVRARVVEACSVLLREAGVEDIPECVAELG